MQSWQNSKIIGKKTIKKRTIKKRKKQIGIKNIKKIQTISIIALVLLTLIFTFRIRISGDKYRVQAITISTENDTQRDNNPSEALVQKEFYNKSHFQLRLGGKSKLEKKIIEKFPIIKSITVESFSQGKINILIKYQDPQLILISEMSGNVLGVYENTIYDFLSGSYTHSGAYHLHIPPIYSVTSSSKGIFHKSDISSLSKYLKAIYENFSPQKINYHIGGNRLIIEQNSKRFFVHTEKDIEEQLQKLENIRSTIENRDNVLEVDLSSSEKPIVKFKNN